MGFGGNQRAGLSWISECLRYLEEEDSLDGYAQIKVTNVICFGHLIFFHKFGYVAKLS